MRLNKYYLSDFAKSHMFDRNIVLTKPKITFIGNQQVGEELAHSSEFIRNETIPVKFSRLQNSLIFGFDCDESRLQNNYNGLVIGFRDLSCSNSASEQEVMILIDLNNLYGGISGTDITDTTNLINERRAKAQLKIGYNTIIINNIFNCQFLFDEIIQNDLTNSLTLDKGYDIDHKSQTESHISKLVTVPLNSRNQLKLIYPYYEKI